MISALICGLLLAHAPALPAPYPHSASKTLPPAAVATTYAVRAKELYTGYGKVFANGVLVVENGRVMAIGDKVKLPAGIPVIEHDGALSPGLIAVHDFSSTVGDNYDSTRSLLAEAEIYNALDRDHSDLGRLLEAGITTIVLTPSALTLVGGTTCVVRTDGSVLRQSVHLSLGMSSSALRTNREPTSYPGALRMLRAELKNPTGRLADLVAGKLPAFAHVRSRADVLRTITLAEEFGFKAALNGPVRFDEIAAEVKAANMAAVLGPFGVGSDVHIARSARELAAADVPFAFALGAPYQHPEALRFGAALSVREGLSSERALRALTTDAALVAGVADLVGSLDVGTAADFVLWSGNPVDLTSSVEAVYLRGELAHGGGK